MKINIALVSILFVFLIFTRNVYADDITPSPSPSTSPTPTEMDQSTSASSTIQSIKNFITNIDSIGGGFVFTTPEDLFTDAVHLTDGTAINNLSLFRNAFIAMSIPMSALLIFWIGGSNMTMGKMGFIKPFIGRIIFYAVLVMLVPTFFTLSIKMSNALTTSLLNAPVIAQPETNLVSFSSDFYDKANSQIASGQSTPESLGVASNGWTSFFQSVGHAIMVIFLCLTTVIFLIFGLIFILTQFTLRFLGMLFLSLIFPLVLPFVITEKTEGIFYSYLKIWFTFLIHQPAFVLGYMMVMMISRNILANHGASLGLLFLYISALFFLGTVNVLAARIFADAWVALGANLEAGAFAGSLLSGGMATAKFAVRNRDNIANGVRGIGKSIGESIESFSSSGLSKRVPNFAWNKPSGGSANGNLLNSGFRAGVDTMYGNPPTGSSVGSLSGAKLPDTRAITAQIPQARSMPIADFLPPYSKEFRSKGFGVSKQDANNGVYAVSGKAYSYYDSKNNLSHTFSSRKDALDSGYSGNEIRTVSISKRNVVDLSHFKKENPHNTTATKQAQKLGFPSNYAHVTKRSDPIRVKHNLEMNKNTFSKLGVEGYMTKHYDNPDGSKSKRPTTRIISLGKVGE